VEGVDVPDRVGADLATLTARTVNQPAWSDLRTEEVDGKVCRWCACLTHPRDEFFMGHLRGDPLREQLGW
jgi:hypothetical protein